MARFSGWLERHLTGWRTDPVFQQRALIRDLRRGNPELQALEAERLEASAAYAESRGHEEIDAVRRQLAGAANGVAGLSHALSRVDDDAERQRLEAKLDDFRGRVAQLEADLAELTAASPEWRALEDVRERLDRLRRAVGFDEAVAQLSVLQRRQGRSSGRSGTAFERTAIEAVRRVVLPALESDGGARSPVILRGVHLGAARTEIDQLVVRPGPEPDAPVEVLALVEAKRNPNDIAHGLRRRLENLSWLAGYRQGYDAAEYRTAAYTSGHFDVAGVHVEGGVEYRFTPESFRRFLPDLEAGALPRDLFLVTRDGRLWGIGSGGLARIAHRVATDLAWDPDDTDYLAALLDWCQGLTAPVEAPDVLRRYDEDPEGARRVIVVREQS